MWVYKRTEPGLYTVGFYTPDGKWMPESDHGTKEEAAARVHYLNGGNNATMEKLDVYNCVNSHEFFVHHGSLPDFCPYCGFREWKFVETVEIKRA